MPSYKRIGNKEKKEASIDFWGKIGKGVNGNEIVSDLTVAGEQMNTIHWPINSGGGSVFQGFSIVLGAATTGIVGKTQVKNKETQPVVLSIWIN